MFARRVRAQIARKALFRSLEGRVVVAIGTHREGLSVGPQRKKDELETIDGTLEVGISLDRSILREAICFVAGHTM